MKFIPGIAPVGQPVISFVKINITMLIILIIGCPAGAKNVYKKIFSTNRLPRWGK
jgi:hypothetical protein